MEDFRSNIYDIRHAGKTNEMHEFERDIYLKPFVRKKKAGRERNGIRWMNEIGLRRNTTLDSS